MSSSLCAVTGKVRYRTWCDVQDAMAGHGVREGVYWLRAYRCPGCKGWHTTSKPRLRSVRLRNRQEMAG